jgi:cytochrome c oxidase assembly protein subunit 15
MPMVSTASNPVPDDSYASMQRLLRAAAFAGVLVVLLVITTSAFLRLRALGLGCEDWPACYARGSEAMAASSPAPARVVHRLSATLAGAAVLAIGLIACGRPRDFRRELVLTAAMLVLLIGLAWLGRSTPSATVPAVALGNVLGGLLLAALLWWLALGAPRAARSGRAWLAVLSWCALLLIFLQIGLGVLTSASHSGLACTALAGCGPDGGAGPWLPAEMNPWRPPAASATIHMAHRALALASTGAAGLVILGLRTAAPRLAAVLGLLLTVQLGLGAALVLASLPLVLAVLHNLVGALLLLALVAAHHRILSGRA